MTTSWLYCLLVACKIMSTEETVAGVSVPANQLTRVHKHFVLP